MESCRLNTGSGTYTGATSDSGPASNVGIHTDSAKLLAFSLHILYNENIRAKKTTIRDWLTSRKTWRKFSAVCGHGNGGCVFMGEGL